MPKAHVSPLPPLRLTDVHITVVSSEEKTAKCSRWASAEAARAQPGEQALAGPVGAADRQVGMDGISWKGPTGETIQLTSAQSQ